MDLYNYSFSYVTAYGNRRKTVTNDYSIPFERVIEDLTEFRNDVEEIGATITKIHIIKV